MKKSTSSIDMNHHLGGHVWKHIGGLKSIPHGAVIIKEGRSLFRTEKEFKNAWQKLKGKARCRKQNRNPFFFGKNGNKKARIIKKNPPGDCEKASTLGILKAHQCPAKAVDQNGLCTYTKSFTPKSVEFYYKVNDNNDWILNTAFPSKRPCKRLPNSG